MPDDDNTNASQGEQDLSNDALDRAAEDIGESEEFTEHEEEVEAREEEEAGEESEEEGAEFSAEQEEEEEGVIPPEPEDNGERSKLGRKVKYIEDTVLSFQESFGEKMDRLEALLASNNRKQDNHEFAEPEDEEEFVGTKADLKNFLNDYNREQEGTRQKAQMNYEKGYIQTIKRLGSEETAEDHQDIYDEMMSHFNVKHSDDPLMDAEKNYLKATRAVLKKKTAEPAKKVNPLKGKKPKAPLGAGSNNETMPKKTRPVPKFDEAAADFMKKSGITPERAAEILEGDSPANLGRR